MPTTSSSPHINWHPYSMVLSALWKTELIHLSLELRLPTDGSVVTLRNQPRCYLNSNCETLVWNTRCSTLFPCYEHTNPLPSPCPSSNTLQASLPVLLYHSPSTTPSFASWHGIKDQPQDMQNLFSPQPHQPPIHPQEPPPPSSPPSSSSSSDSDSEHGPTPPPIHAPKGCRSTFSVTQSILHSTLSYSHWTLCSHSYSILSSYPKDVIFLFFSPETPCGLSCTMTLCSHFFYWMDIM